MDTPFNRRFGYSLLVTLGSVMLSTARPQALTQRIGLPDSPPAASRVTLAKQHSAVVESGGLGTSSATATCGNGVIEFPEVCDDGNTIEPDHCSADCLRVCPIVITGDAAPMNKGTVESMDIIWVLGYLFKGGPPPDPCIAAGEVNCDGRINSADVIFMVNFVFKAGPQPCDACYSTAPC